jgi:hypothetical protein
MGCSPGNGAARRDLAGHPTMLDDDAAKKFKKGRDVHEAYHLH